MCFCIKKEKIIRAEIWNALKTQIHSTFGRVIATIVILLLRNFQYFFYYKKLILVVFIKKKTYDIQHQSNNNKLDKYKWYYKSGHVLEHTWIPHCKLYHHKQYLCMCLPIKLLILFLIKLIMSNMSIITKWEYSQHPVPAK